MFFKKRKLSEKQLSGQRFLETGFDRTVDQTSSALACDVENKPFEHDAEAVAEANQIGDVDKAPHEPS
jgi:hypothetical protein